MVKTIKEDKFMKKRLYRAKVVLLMLGVISVMGMTACSFEPKEKTVSEASIEPKPTEEETIGVEKPETVTMKTEDVKPETTGAEETSTNEREILAYITDFNVDIISIDAIEWVTVPSSRADELGIKEEEGPSGFCIYNPDILTEQFPLSADCTITVLDWQNSYEPQTISAEKFFAVLQERGEQNNFIPYAFTITNGTMTEISEHYVP